MKKYVVFGVVMLCLLDGYCQDLEKDLSKLTSLFESDHYSFNVALEGFTHPFDKKPDLNQKGMVRKYGLFYYSNLGDSEVMIGSGGMVEIDHEAMTIEYTETLPRFEFGKKAVDLSWLKSSENYTWSGLKENISTYHLKSGQDGFHNIRISFDVNTGFLHEVSYELKSGKEYETALSKVVIHYTGFTKKKTGEASFFKLSKYLNIRGKEVSTVETYASYQLVVHE